METLLKFWTLAFITYAVAAPPGQVPLGLEPGSHGADDAVDVSKKRPLHGRFLHITDFHPDRFYELYSSTEKDDACHSGKGPAGIYGAEMSDCDSPIALVNKTLGWVDKHLRDKIDFVIWTGDSARHDNDENFPRDAKQVTELNEFMVSKFEETLGKRKGDDGNPNNDFVVPIVPTFGNNDILPHNIFTKGPNKWTRTYSKIWKQFIPEEQRHQFEQGGWFYVEVIPSKLAVFSLNTMYFFTSNAAADGCAQKSEPGYRQMEWLRIQLQFLRQRGMKAILTGHVPPARTEAKTSWDETCWQKYTLWLRQYRDVVVSSHYGHFNYDHFILQDFEDLRKGTKKGKMPDYKTQALDAEDGEMHAAVSSNYFIELRDRWSKLPQPPKSMNWPDGVGEENVEVELVKGGKDKKKKEKDKKKKKREDFLDEIGGEYAERYALSYVTASVVPNLFPTLRVFEYNITGLDANDIAIDAPLQSQPRLELRDASIDEADDDDDDFDNYISSVDAAKKKKKKKKHKKKKKNKKTKFTVPSPPSKSSPPGPAYSPQTFSLLKYTQYLANLTHINNDFPMHSSEGSVGMDKWHEGKHKGKKPHDRDYKPKPKKFGFGVHYGTQDDDVYQLKDLTMPRMVDLASRIGSFSGSSVTEGQGTEEEFVDVEESEGEEDHGGMEDDGVEAEKHKKKKHRKHKKKKGKKGKKQDEVWFTFVRRAFVETLSPEEIEEEFG